MDPSYIGGFGSRRHGDPTAATARETKRTICCHCGVFCGALVDVGEDGRPVAIRGDADHPVSRGFLCVRGRAAIEYHEHRDRLEMPLRRVGRRGAGDWEQVSWDDALDDIAARILAVRSEYGAEAFAYLNGTLHGADGWFGVRLANLLGSPNSGGTGLVCAGPQFAAGALTFGLSPAFPEVVPGTTEAVLLWGYHPSASAPPFWGRVRDAMRAGAKLVVVDSRPTLEARRSDVWLQPRPGTDAALALAYLHALVAEGLWDRDFVERWTVGFEALRARLEEYAPESVAAVTGVAPEDVRAAARIHAGAAAAAVASGKPNGQGRNALALERSLALVTALTGNLDRPGGNRLPGPVAGVGSEVTYDAYDELAPEQRRKRLGADRFRLHGEGLERLGEAAGRVWPGARNPVTRRALGIAHPPSIWRAVATGEPYPVRALLVQHHNPLGAWTGSQSVHRALTSPRLDLLVVHELFMTPTAMLADYVLPAASWMEKSFLFSTGWGLPVVSGERVTEPRGERRSDYDLCRDLGRRLGQEWPDSVEDVWDEWLREAGTTFAELVRSESWWIPAPAARARHAETDPATGEPVGFGTPSGKVELASSVLDELGYDPLPAFDPSGLVDEAAFPVRLMTGATRIDATHQDHRQIESLRRRRSHPVVEIDPRLAHEHGIEDGDWVRITTPRGSFSQRARLVPGLGRDRVNAERWWYPERDPREPSLFGFWEANVNAYTDDDLELCDPAYGGVPYRVARCRIEAAPPVP